MAFEGTTQATDAAARKGSRYLGEGFRQEPDFRDGTTVSQDVSTPATGDNESTLTLNRRPSPPNLEYVFDDPAEGEPGRDRILVHGLWELILAVAVAGVGYLLLRQEDAVDGIDGLLVSASVLGALAVGSALALRAGAANLAVGAVAVAAALYFGQHSDGGLLQPLAIVVGVCAIIGAVQGLVIVGLHVPGWATSLAIGLVLSIWSSRQAPVTMVNGYDPLPHASYWFGGLVAISVVGAAAGLVPAVRRAVGRFRPVGDPADRRGLLAALITFCAVVVSTILSGVAGVLLVAQTQKATPSDGLELTALALGAALLGGTSVFGRRGGIFGTVLAAILLTVAMSYAESSGRNWPTAAFAAVAIGLGLAVSRLIEYFGRPTPGDEGDEHADDDWAPKTHSFTGSGWSSGGSPSGTGAIWASDETWGSTERR
jgi:ribose/xylose/arabinose/galactoside ABC-type transport system permease subunit